MLSGCPSSVVVRRASTFDVDICDKIFMKLGQNVCFDNIKAKFEYVMSGQKLGYQLKSKVILVYSLEARFATRF